MPELNWQPQRDCPRHSLAISVLCVTAAVSFSHLCNISYSFLVFSSPTFILFVFFLCLEMQQPCPGRAFCLYTRGNSSCASPLSASTTSVQGSDVSQWAGAGPLPALLGSWCAPEQTTHPPSVTSQTLDTSCLCCTGIDKTTSKRALHRDLHWGKSLFQPQVQAKVSLTVPVCSSIHPIIPASWLQCWCVSIAAVPRTHQPLFGHRALKVSVNILFHFLLLLFRAFFFCST